MAKEAKQRFVLSLTLNTEKYQEDILRKRFEIGRQLYNAILGQSLKRYHEMTKTKRWRANQASIADIYKTNPDKSKARKMAKPYFDIRNDMLSEFRLSEYSLHEDIAPMQKVFRKNLDAFTAQKIATRVWKAFDRRLYGNGESVHFKKYPDGLKSLEGKSNGTGMRYRIENNRLEWNGLSIAVNLDRNNRYEIYALRNRICYCGIKRIFVRGEYRYILQLMLEGVPPIKTEESTGKVKNGLGLGRCGIDIGTQTVAFVTDHDCKLYELAPGVQNIEDERRRIQRYLDRSRRYTNQNNFNDDDTIKSGVRLKWLYSKKYRKARNKLKDMYRKQAAIRQQEHHIIANEILRTCDTVLVEAMNFKGLQSRAKITEKNEKGEFWKKKRFGKSLANKAPSMFLDILKNKLKAKGGLYSEVNTYKVKASQYNHLDGKYNKKELSQRWNHFDHEDKIVSVQRDLYAAYLIKNVDADLETINQEQCRKDFDKFLNLHTTELLRLQGLNNLSSIGI